MKYFDKELYKKYSTTSSKKYTDEWNVCERNFRDYLNTIKKSYPKKLLKIFENTLFFHDFQICNFIYCTKRDYQSKQNDMIAFYLISDMVAEEISIIIEFDNVIYFKCETNNAEYISNKIVSCGLDRIITSEIGIDDNGNYTFSFFTANDANFEIVFKAVRMRIRNGIDGFKQILVF